MAGKFTFKSNREEFQRKHESFIELVTSRMAVTTETYLKVSAGMPVKTGRMKSATRSFKNKRGSWRTEIDVEYAGVQEAGVRLTGKGSPAVIQNYSTPGTGHHFFARAIDNNNQNKEQYVHEAAVAVGLI